LCSRAPCSTAPATHPPPGLANRASHPSHPARVATCPSVLQRAVLRCNAQHVAACEAALQRAVLRPRATVDSQGRSELCTPYHALSSAAKPPVIPGTRKPARPIGAAAASAPSAEPPAAAGYVACCVLLAAQAIRLVRCAPKALCGRGVRAFGMPLVCGMGYPSYVGLTVTNRRIGHRCKCRTPCNLSYNMQHATSRYRERPDFCAARAKREALRSYRRRLPCAFAAASPRLGGPGTSSTATRSACTRPEQGAARRRSKECLAHCARCVQGATGRGHGLELASQVATEQPLPSQTRGAHSSE
jgi:hypothetical protein